MLPVVTPEEMGAIDRAATEPVDVLIGRAAGAVVAAAMDLLDGAAYGRRIVVIAGPGNNGNDGRVAAERLRRWGAAVHVIPAAEAPSVLPASDLVIDAAYGTGFRGSYETPDPAGSPVLAVDIPSGIDGLTGVRRGRAPRAIRTVTFAAWKPGLLLGDGRAHAGEVRVADIGLDCSRARVHLVEHGDLVGVPARPLETHKWRSAVWVVGGSPGMGGAPRLCAAAALRAGAGYVRLSIPGDTADRMGAPLEAVTVALEEEGWSDRVVADVDRFAALAVGPGLGRTEGALAEVRRLLSVVPTPVVLDGDGLLALAGRPRDLRGRPGTTVLTPHDGEFERLTGAPPGEDRIEAARTLAREAAAVVLLKGSTTVVAGPDGSARLSTAGDPRLATAGTGDVLTGVIAALLARGVAPLDAAALGAEWHGRAARLGPAVGLVASDLPGLLPVALPPDREWHR